MRVVVCCLCLFALAACARDDVPLGTEGPATTGGNNSTTGGGSNTNTTGSDEPTTGGLSTGNSNELDANSGGGNDANSSGGAECASASCESPTDDLGKIDASDPDAVVMRTGAGSAFLTLVGTDESNSGGLMGPYLSNGIIGIKAVLSAPAGSSYELHIVGNVTTADDEACSANESTGTATETTAVWNGMGPVASAPDKQLSIEVRHLDGPCDQDWTLTLTGLPCTAATLAGPSCP